MRDPLVGDPQRGAPRGLPRKHDDVVRVTAGPLGIRRQLGPGEVRQGGGDSARRPPAGQSWICGGKAAIIGWSLSITPSLAAPPGEPRSSKKSTLAL